MAGRGAERLSEPPLASVRKSHTANALVVDFPLGTADI
jgi:hypothetical protein